MAVIYIFKCKDCGKNIVLDDTVLSKNGKEIPLDQTSRRPHQCPYKPKQVFECKGCGKDITFSDFELSKYGNKIPLNPKTFAHHRCPARPFNRETRRQWWYEQQAKARADRERARRQQQQQQRHKHDDGSRKDYQRDRQVNPSKYQRYAQALGVGMNATNREIELAYRKKLLELHPDRNTSVPWEVANAQCAFLNEAYANFNLDR